jgi:hypothetical protein
MSMFKFDVSTKLAMFVVLLLMLLILGPLLVIASLNVLFGLNIEFSLTTWGAVVILHAFFHSAIKMK